ncbi:MAG: AAA family ATPase [Gammaproteobacteria bacterium]|nr:AAA family ATPase [Gammaproteobacteria bacterium]
MTDPGLTTIPDPNSGIRISRLIIRNFRCIDELRLDLEPGTTYLVGENNAGKTSVLLALWSALGSRRPLDYDLRHGVDDSPADEA